MSGIPTQKEVCWPGVPYSTLKPNFNGVDFEGRKFCIRGNSTSSLFQECPLQWIPRTGQFWYYYLALELFGMMQRKNSMKWAVVAFCLSWRNNNIVKQDPSATNLCDIFWCSEVEKTNYWNESQERNSWLSLWWCSNPQCCISCLDWCLFEKIFRFSLHIPRLLEQVFLMHLYPIQCKCHFRI